LVTSKERFIGDTSSLFFSFLFSNLSLSLSLSFVSLTSLPLFASLPYFSQKTKKDGEEEEKGSAEIIIIVRRILLTLTLALRMKTIN
jgi:hypothetical protein